MIPFPYDSFLFELNDPGFAKEFLIHCFESGYVVGETKNTHEILGMADLNAIHISKSLFITYYLKEMPTLNQWVH